MNDGESMTLLTCTMDLSAGGHARIRKGQSNWIIAWRLIVEYRAAAAAAVPDGLFAAWPHINIDEAQSVDHSTLWTEKNTKMFFWYTVYKTWPIVIKFGTYCSE